MRGYRKIVEREIINHKKRSILTVIIILLGVSSIIFLNEIDSLEKRYSMSSSNYESGDKHFSLRNIIENDMKILENNSLIEKIGLSYEEVLEVEKITDTGEAIEKQEKVFYGDEDYINSILDKEYYTLEGRVPLNENEAIVLDKYEMNSKVGSKVKVDGKERTIVGSIKDNVKNDNQRDRILLGLNSLEGKKLLGHVRLKSNENIVENAMQIAELVGIKDKMIWSGSSEDIEKLKEKRTIDLNIKKINLYNQTVQVEGMVYKRVNVSIMLVSLVGITLVFLTYIAINAAVKEKKKNFSILKCMGASNGQIRSLIIKESIILATVSIIPGIILGEIVFLILRPKLIYIFGNLDFNMSHNLSIKPIVITIITVLLICLLASLKPMIWITKLSPVEGIRDESILGCKKRIPSKFVRKILGYEGELAYKNLKGGKGSFLGLTLIMILALVIFNVFTSYYSYKIKAVKADFGVLERDIQVEGLKPEVIKILNESKRYGDYSRYTNISNTFKIEGIDSDILKDSESFLYLDKEKNKVVSKESGIITVINDKCFEDLLPYIEGDKLTLEKFKKDGAILFSNGERGSLNKPIKNNSIKLQLTDLEIGKVEGEERRVKDKAIFETKNSENLDLNLLGTMYFETLLGPTMTFSWEFIGLIISEETAKKFKGEYDTLGSGIANFEFENEKLREEHLPVLEGRLKGDVKENIYPHYVTNSYERKLDNMNFINTFAGVMYTILGYILSMMLVCLINIRDIILNGRKKEFGIMFAVGMDKKMLRKCLVYEGVIQGTIALIIGNIISVAMLQILKLNEMKFVYPKWILFLGSLIIIGVSAINTWNSIRRLGTDKPVEMIRNIE